MPIAAAAGTATRSRDASPERLRSLFGTESEYAVSGARGGQPLPPSDVAHMLLACADHHPHLRGVEAGMFLPNGGRFYIDQSHPEWASPECTNPWEAVRHSLAGDLFLSRLAAELVRDDPSVTNLAVRKGNIDYLGQVTWGHHENYLLRRDPVAVRPGLVSHLVTRVVFAGAGGFDPFDTRHARFVLSPRALFLRRSISMSLPSFLSLVDERAQHHCAGYFRQHLMCGEGLQSHLAALLRLGTTALVVALVDGQLSDLSELDLAEPLEALATVACDQTLQRPLRLRGGGALTALDVQRHLLREARLHGSSLPQWSGALCDQWQDVLDRLARGPDAVADRLDWAIKLAMFRRRARTKGHVWPSQDVIGMNWVGASGATEQWRAELCELDVLFGQVYPPSVFDSLDRAGVLAHRVPGIDHIDAALTTPPAGGRARLRGEAVSRLAGRAGFKCAWNGVHDLGSRSSLDLADPFATVATWTRVPSAPSSASGLPADEGALRRLAERLCAPDAHEDRRTYASHAIELNNRGITLRSAGRLEGAVTVLRAALAVDVQVRPAGHPKLPHRRNNLAGALLMLGRLDEAVGVVSTAWAEKGDRYDRTSARILATRLVLAMRLGEPTALFLGQLKTHLAIQPLPDFAEVDRRWTVAPALALLAHHLGDADMRLLHAITGFLNGESVEALRALPAWMRAFPRPLDEPWPATTPEA